MSRGMNTQSNVHARGRMFASLTCLALLAMSAAVCDGDEFAAASKVDARDAVSTADSDEQPATEERAGEEAMAIGLVAASQQCGASCPEDHHKTWQGCNVECLGDCIYLDNAAKCEPNQGNVFSQCGTWCPAGYHKTWQGCSFDCRGDCIYHDNASKCEKN